MAFLLRPSSNRPSAPLLQARCLRECPPKKKLRELKRRRQQMTPASYSVTVNIFIAGSDGILMAFEIRKISDVGVGHPVVARLGVQMSELLNWSGLEKSKQNAISGLYIHTLTWRLLRCYKSRDEIVRL